MVPSVFFLVSAKCPGLPRFTRQNPSPPAGFLSTKIFPLHRSEFGGISSRKGCSRKCHGWGMAIGWKTFPGSCDWPWSERPKSEPTKRFSQMVGLDGDDFPWYSLLKKSPNKKNKCKKMIYEIYLSQKKALNVTGLNFKSPLIGYIFYASSSSSKCHVSWAITLVCCSTRWRKLKSQHFEGSWKGSKIATQLSTVPREWAPG